ncbi:helix-turn-helix domain-containing protein [Marinilactibacillus sp. XAAS-LB27]|uniref:helix-turn-helix domain-containing protein n=1 Tax=Marinilactibacillus sp. XAAS-LB27 TaxID=3114538 RepID=UPI002E18EB94|nr:helix-turn-helix domain-containing protein [Marinilactibacillus sp. XAAS-LB27]
MKIGDKIKEGRLNKGYTQEQVAEILHVSRSTISSWEVNRTYPPLDMLVTLGDLYEISLDVILREDIKVVENIVKETKRSRNRKYINIALLILFIPLIVFMGYNLWASGKDVSYKQIKDVQIALNGEAFNKNSEIIITADFDGLHNYGGYMIEGGNGELTLSLGQYYELSDRSLQKIVIPLEHVISPSEEVKKIELITRGSKVMIYDIDNPATW